MEVNLVQAAGKVDGGHGCCPTDVDDGDHGNYTPPNNSITQEQKKKELKITRKN